jgi:hypothetical protein
MAETTEGQRRQQTVHRETLRDGSALRQILARTRAPVTVPVPVPEPSPGVDLEPGCAYGVVTRAMVDALMQELRIIRGRVDSLLSLVVGAIVLDVLLRLAGLR